VVWYYRSNPDNPELRRTGEKIESSVRSAGASIEEKLRSLNLDGKNIEDEMKRTGRVIRENAREAGETLSDATADARTTAAIKAAFVKDPDLSAWDISVNTTGGVVTLSGAVSNADHIGRAMAVALDTEGVRQVISTLQVKPPSR
jgi:hyperosmotically inducible protein